MAARFGPERYAVMTLQQTGFAIGADGSVEPLKCLHRVQAGEGDG
jgi:hypothetical protein